MLRFPVGWWIFADLLTLKEPPAKLLLVGPRPPSTQSLQLTELRRQTVPVDLLLFLLQKVKHLLHLRSNIIELI